MKRFFVFFLLFGLISCGLAEPEEKTVELKDIKLELGSRIEAVPGDAVTIGFTKDFGPSKTDLVVLRQTIGEENVDTELQINNLQETSFEILLPGTFKLGSYKFCLKRDKILKGYGTVSFVKPGSGDSSEQDPTPVVVTPDLESTVYGIVECDGVGVANVVVSDGYEAVKTDSKGIYQLKSNKRTGYVFISIPSGYEVACNGVLPLFFQNTAKDAEMVERIDFKLYDAGDQTNHTMLYFGDMHLANRTNDRKQFTTFTNEIAAYMRAHKDEKVYALSLGDMCWDLYWYSNNYCYAEYLADVNKINPTMTNALGHLQIFHTIGNHDHDMNATGDWDTVLRFRQDICPNYYSLNIGDIHYIVIDDIECTNYPASTTNGSGRSYNNKVVSDVLNWLRKDISFVDKSTPVVVTMHAPVFTMTGSNALSNTASVVSALDGYDVTFVTGHTHNMYYVEKESVREYNSGAVCAAWWWAGKYYPTFNIGTDGSPSGYRIATVQGKNQSSVYKSVGRDINYQFRAYDRNSICITASNYGVPSDRSATLAKEDKGNYSMPSSANEILVNVWDYNPSWKVEMLENGNPLTVTRLNNAYDPGFMIAYIVPRLKESASITWQINPTNHIFSANASAPDSNIVIKVTDDEGNVYSQTMQRPFALIPENYK